MVSQMDELSFQSVQVHVGRNSRFLGPLGLGDGAASNRLLAHDFA